MDSKSFDELLASIKEAKEILLKKRKPCRIFLRFHSLEGN